jgi:hypothetical protein
MPNRGKMPKRTKEVRWKQALRDSRNCAKPTTVDVKKETCFCHIAKGTNYYGISRRCVMCCEKALRKYIELDYEDTCKAFMECKETLQMKSACKEESCWCFYPVYSDDWRQKRHNDLFYNCRRQENLARLMRWHACGSEDERDWYSFMDRCDHWDEAYDCRIAHLPFPRRAYDALFGKHCVIRPYIIKISP